jgi:alpha-D-ribose 1-methylphosphonate 5-triphosphate synthase subunit PhnG
VERHRRNELLATLPPATARGLAGRVLDGTLGEASVVGPPSVGMIMARAVDGAHGEPFNLAEVLVTEARVVLGGQEGWGMVVGRAPDHALAIAVLDAGLAAGHHAGEAIERELDALAAGHAARLAQEWARLAPTRVDFDNF